MRSKDGLLRLQRFRVEEKRRQMVEIETMIAEFERKLEDLDQQVKAEETRTGVTDPHHYNYSLTAKSIRSRRDNLVKSVADLRSRVEPVRAQFAEAEAELRKVELLAEKDGGGGSPTAAPGGTASDGFSARN